MINFNKNKLINETLDKYYETFSHTLDTADYVPEKYNEKICKYIFKNMKKAFRKIDKEDRKYQKELNRKNKEKILRTKGEKTNTWSKFFHKLFRKRKSADSNN
jgi:hypothetical protein